MTATVALTPVNPETSGHVQFLYSLVLEREPATWISTKGPPSYHSHAYFVANHPYRYWWIIEHDGMMVGSLYFGNDNSIGVSIAKRFRRRRFAWIAIKMAMSAHPPLPGIASVRPAVYVANIAPNNPASVDLFEKLGFKLLQLTYGRES